MTILVTGATGTIGKEVLANLVGKGADMQRTDPGSGQGCLSDRSFAGQG